MLYRRFLGRALVLMGLACGAASTLVANTPAEAPAVVAVLDQRVITTLDLDLYVAERRVLDPAVIDYPLPAARRLVLGSALRERLLSDWAELQISPPTDDIVDSAATATLARYRRDAGGEMAFRLLLEDLGLTHAEFSLWLKDTTRRRMLAGEGVRYFANLPTLPDRSSVSDAVRLQLAHIQILTPHPDLEAAALDRMLLVRRDVEAGLDFAEAARLYSQDVYTSDSGGVLGWLEPATLSPEVRAAVESLPAVDAITPVVRTSGSLHIFKLLDYDTPQQREYLDRMLRAERRRLREIIEETDIRLATGYTFRWEDDIRPQVVVGGD